MAYRKALVDQGIVALALGMGLMLASVGLTAQPSALIVVTGTVRSAPASGSFLLTLGPGRVVRVMGLQARYVSGGKPAAITSLKLGTRVQVQGRRSFGQMTAVEVTILGSAPLTEAVPLPPLRLDRVHDISSLNAAQVQIHNRVGTLLGAFPGAVVQPGRYSSLVPIRNPNDLSSNPNYFPPLPTVNQLAPVVSMFADGDQFGDLEFGPVPPGQIASALFFQDPPPAVPGWTIQGILNSTLPLEQGNVATTLASGGNNPIAPVGYIAVNSTAVNLVIPCYWLEGYGYELYDHAHFEVKVEYESTTPGSWQPLTTAALELGNSVGYTSPGGFSSVTQVSAGMTGAGYPWVVPIILPAVATTLRVDVYSALYSTTKGDQPDPNLAYWKFPDGLTGASYGPVGSPVSNGTIIADPQAGHHQWLASSPFQIVLLPTQFLPGDVLPYGMIYLPPGNQSSEKFETYQSYGISASYSVGNQTSTQVANVQSTSFTLAPNLSSFAGVTLPVVGLTVSPNTTQTGGYVSGDNQTEVVSLTVSSESGPGIDPPSGLPPGDALCGAQQSYWSDRIIVVPNPILGVWNYPSAPSQPAFAAAQLIAYGNNGEPVAIHDLFQCATGTGFNDGVLNLTPGTCASLLLLDPFYVAGWQGAAPPVGRAINNQTQPSPVYGSKPGLSGQNWNFDTKTIYQSSSALGQLQGSSSGQGNGGGTTASFNIAGNGFSVQTGQSATTTVSVTYSPTQSTISGNGIDVSGQMKDTGQIDVSNISVWLDAVFGGVMFQDTNQRSYCLTSRPNPQYWRPVLAPAKEPIVIK